MEEKDSTQGEQNPEASGTNAEPPKQETIEFRTLLEIGGFINYIGDPTLLEFMEPIKDKNDQVLIQKNTTLRQKLFENLLMRKTSDLPEKFVFKYSKGLKERLKALVARPLFISLTKEQYHIAPALLKITDMDHSVIYGAVMENRSMLDRFVALHREKNPLLPHLGETAMLCGVITENLCRHLREIEPRRYYAAVRMAFQAGLLHDIALAEDDNFLMDDIENAKESGHEKKSAEIIRGEMQGIDPVVIEAVAAHHREEAPYSKSHSPQLSVQQVIRESLSFAEFFYCQFRSIYQYRNITKESYIGQMFYTIGEAFSFGLFHPAISQIISRVRESLKAIMFYGIEIGKIERACIYIDSALAYPAPRCTQVLCKNRVMNCELIQPNFPINVVQPTRYFGTRWDMLRPGNYPKCQLTDKLPDPPEEIQKL